MARRKEETRFDVAEVEKAISDMEKKENLKLSLSELMRFNIQRFKNTGLSRRTIYDRLVDSGLNLGTFNAFSLCWTRVEKSGKFLTTPSETKTSEPAKIDKAEEESKPEEKAQEKPKRKPYTIRAADGTELFVDPETGGKTFEIKSSKKK